MGKLGKIIYHPEYEVQRSRTELESLIAQLCQESLSNVIVRRLVEIGVE